VRYSPEIELEPLQSGLPQFLLVLVSIIWLTAAVLANDFGIDHWRVGPPRALPDGLVEAEATWRAAELHSYTMAMIVHCECEGGAWRVDVRDGRMARAHSDEYGATGDASELVATLTVDQLFEQLRFASEKGYAVVRANFDPVRGYPTELLIDRRAEVDDDHIQLRISSLEPLVDPR
jgi:hypothetical protein